MGFLKKNEEYCPRCNHQLLFHSTLLHHAPVIITINHSQLMGGRTVTNGRSNLRNEKGKISYCYACRTKGKTCERRPR